MKKDALKKQYQDITSLYDMAEELANTVESEFVKNPDEQLAIIEPLINDIADSADMLAEEYISLLEAPTRKKSAKTRIETALRKIFMALEEYRKRVLEIASGVVVALSNIADPVVDKIRKQIEKITIIFMNLLEISLDRIMRKNEVDEFKRVNEKLFTSLPQMGY